MKAARSLALALLSTACLGACQSSTPPPPRGAPLLTHVYWVAGGKSELVYAHDASLVLQSVVSPYATEVDFVFDRRLDGDRIEDTVTDGGVVRTRPKDVPPIAVSWPAPGDAGAGGAPFRLVVAYNSAGRFGADSAYVFARPLVPGFPSNGVVTFTLDRANLASAYGEAADAPETIGVNTAAFAVGVDAPTLEVKTTFEVPLRFSNRVAEAATLTPFVHVTSGGATVPVKVLVDASDASRAYVAPADCLGAWPARSTFTLTIDAALPDAFGRPLTKGVTATFKTGGAFSVPDAACPFSPGDGGAADAEDGSDGGGLDAPADGAPDAPGDGGVADAEAALDARADGGVPDAAPDAPSD